ncbi:acyltransferase [Acidimicrobiia bacterium EGI L10123]|uniref:acyltransferase n=1 Tax=Salinilacustrithrix flava TaxID=2957203 RepID=UPI003D7C251C|nr:acyltransferase [Acidimicrobiia bacterium EGI L10123]
MDDHDRNDGLDQLPPWTPPADLPAFAAFGPYSELGQPTVSVENPAGIHVGAFVKVGAYAVLEALVPERGVTVRIGDGAYIGNFSRITAVGEVVIGEEAMLADRVYVSDTGHVYEDVSQPIKRQGLRDGRRVEVGRGAWIGIGAAIVGNVRIGENAVVAANTVVRSDVPDFTVVAGNPAQVVRRHDGDAWQWMTPRGPA